MEVVVRLLENSPYNAPPQPQPQPDSSRPTLGFPLGTALLLFIIFTLSGIFSCCYHWDKLRHLRGVGGRSFSDSDYNRHSPAKPKPIHSEKRRNENESLPVIMPGDQIARFIALPSPCKPPREDQIVVDEMRPPKPPRMVVPLY